VNKRRPLNPVRYLPGPLVGVEGHLLRSDAAQQFIDAISLGVVDQAAHFNRVLPRSNNNFIRPPAGWHHPQQNA
jgi:hypothetical protein